RVSKQRSHFFWPCACRYIKVFGTMPNQEVAHAPSDQICFVPGASQPPDYLLGIRINSVRIKLNDYPIRFGPVVPWPHLLSETWGAFWIVALRTALVPFRSVSAPFGSALLPPGNAAVPFSWLVDPTFRPE